MNSSALGLLFVLATLIAEGCAQACMKRGAGNSNELDSVWTSLMRIAKTGWPWAMTGFVMFVVGGAFWTLALRRLPVSQAFPLQSLDMVAMAVIARIYLGERISRLRWLAIALILAGTILVGA
jgi:drug/metabolite transporter (DMT)-like permease